MFYLYVLFMFFIFLYIILKNIYLYRTDKYKPHILWSKASNTQFILTMLIAIGTYVGGIFIIHEIEYFQIIVYIFICLSICLLTCINILNYLCYKKSKEHKIIFNTVIFNLITILIILVMLYKLYLIKQ